MHENMNVFEGNQGYFHPFIDPERVGVVPFRRDRSGDRGLCYGLRYTQDLGSVWGSDDKAEVIEGSRLTEQRGLNKRFASFSYSSSLRGV